MSIAASTVRRSALVPARCPAAGGSPRRRAQRPLPSMMIATTSATSGSSCSGSGLMRASVRMRLSSFIAGAITYLDLHDVGLFTLQEVVDLLYVLVGQLLDAGLGRAFVVVTDLAVLDELLEVLHRVPADVANRHAALFGHAPDQLHELLAPLLCQLRDR